MTTAYQLQEQINVPDRRCGHVAYHRAPQCPRLATIHVLVTVEGKGNITMASCEAHQRTIHQVGWIVDAHTFGPGCAHPVISWRHDGCLPGM